MFLLNYKIFKGFFPRNHEQKNHCTRPNIILLIGNITGIRVFEECVLFGENNFLHFGGLDNPGHREVYQFEKELFPALDDQDIFGVNEIMSDSFHVAVVDSRQQLLKYPDEGIQ